MKIFKTNEREIAIIQRDDMIEFMDTNTDAVLYWFEVHSWYIAKDLIQEKKWYKTEMTDYIEEILAA